MTLYVWKEKLSTQKLNFLKGEKLSLPVLSIHIKLICVKDAALEYLHASLKEINITPIAFPNVYWRMNQRRRAICF